MLGSKQDKDGKPLEFTPKKTNAASADIADATSKLSIDETVVAAPASSLSVAVGERKRKEKAEAQAKFHQAVERAMKGPPKLKPNALQPKKKAKAKAEREAAEAKAKALREAAEAKAKAELEAAAAIKAKAEKKAAEAKAKAETEAAERRTSVEHSVQSSKNNLTGNLGFCDEQTSTECVIVGSIPEKDDSTRKTCDDSSKSSEEWSVVGDENIVANATRMIGSALFEEDMTRSQENASFPKQESMVGGPSSSVESLGSSIPTISSKNTSTLSSVGFWDDEKSINAFLRLNAAKIGTGDYVAVTIDEAVDHILKQAEK